MTTDLHPYSQLEVLQINITDTDTDLNGLILFAPGDGRRFSCTFYKDIDMTSSKVQLQKMKIILKVKKKTPCKWPTLEVSKH